MKAKKQSGRKGGVSPSPKDIKRKTTSSKKVLSDDEFLAELLAHFDSLPGFTFVANFPERNFDYVPSYGPTLASAVDLLIRGRHGMPYLGPFPDPQIPVVALPALATAQCPEIVQTVKTHVQELRRRKISFSLCWAAYGESPSVAPHVDWSGDYNQDDVCEKLGEILKDQLAALLE